MSIMNIVVQVAGRHNPNGIVQSYCASNRLHVHLILDRYYDCESYSASTAPQ